jgi:hypothetical protein
VGVNPAFQSYHPWRGQAPSTYPLPPTPTYVLHWTRPDDSTQQEGGSAESRFRDCQPGLGRTSPALYAVIAAAVAAEATTYLPVK